MIYAKLLTPQELGYRKGKLRNGQYFYISKVAAKLFFPRLEENVLNDSIRLSISHSDKLEEMFEASYVFHNDKFCLKDGTRNEFRIYLNNNIASDNLYFCPGEIIALEKDAARHILYHFTSSSPIFSALKVYIENSKSIKSKSHALLSFDEFKQITHSKEIVC